MAPHLCPKCQRPNHENRWKCIYCGAALNPPEKNLPVVEKVKRKAPEHFNLVLLPAAAAEGYDPQKIATEERQWLREHLGVDDFHLDAWLRTKGLRTLRTLKDEAAAAELAKRLTDLGMRAYAVPNEALNQFGQIFHARAVDLQDSWTFYSPKEGKLAFRPEDARVLVKGKIKVERSAAAEKKSGDSSRVESHHFAAETHDYLVFDLYTSAASVPTVRIKSSRFDFHCLGDETHGSSEVNFEKLILRLLKRRADLYIDEHFRLVPPLTRAPAAEFSEEDGEVLMTSASSDYQNNEAQFDQVSRIIYWLYGQGIRLSA